MSEQFFSNIEPLNTTETDGATSGAGGKKLSDYKDVTLLAESRFGKSRVFKAKSSSGTVVIKALKEKFAEDPKCISLLKSEFDITSMLDNRYIRKAISYENIEGLGNSIIFEYVPGKSLWEHVRLGTVDEKQVKNILLEICDALNYMHKNGVIHCDLRPDNIIITDEGHVKLIDIGMPETEYEANKELLVKELEFIAPELIKGEEGDARSDIYSVGKIMEFMYTRNITKQYIDVATPCTQYSKEQRYESVSELKSALTSGRSSFRIVLVLAIVVIAIAVVYGVSKILGAKMEKEDRQREEANFAAALAELRDNIPALCEKYDIRDMTEPLRPDWTDDSLRLAQKLNMLEMSSDMKDQEIKALEEVSDAIYQNRKKNFDIMLLAEFEKANDSVAMTLKKAIPNPTPEQISENANKWFENYVKRNDKK